MLIRVRACGLLQPCPIERYATHVQNWGCGVEGTIN